jgi:gamma-glutamyl AIG2-like cyclotransferase
VLYFFYGTLIDPDVLHAVLRRRIAPQLRRAAVLSGFRRVFRRDASYPVLVPDARSAVEGIVAGPLGQRDAVRLAAYEGPDYVRTDLPVRVEGGPILRAAVFLPCPACPATAREWTPEEWRRCFRPQFLKRVRATQRAGT